MYTDRQNLRIITAGGGHQRILSWNPHSTSMQGLDFAGIEESPSQSQSTQHILNVIGPFIISSLEIRLRPRGSGIKRHRVSLLSTPDLIFLKGLV